EVLSLRRGWFDMFRLGLTTYLLLATAAGPWFCCCTTLRLAESLAAWAKETEAKCETPPTSCCCCKRNRPGDDKPCPATPKSAPDQAPVDDPPSCPCQEQRSYLVAAVALAPQDSQTLHTLAQDLFAMAVFVPAGADQSANHETSIGRVCIFPFLTTEQILHT